MDLLDRAVDEEDVNDDLKGEHRERADVQVSDRGRVGPTALHRRRRRVPEKVETIINRLIVPVSNRSGHDRIGGIIIVN